MLDQNYWLGRIGGLILYVRISKTWNRGRFGIDFFFCGFVFRNTFVGRRGRSVSKSVILECRICKKIPQVSPPFFWIDRSCFFCLVPSSQHFPRHISIQHAKIWTSMTPPRPPAFGNICVCNQQQEHPWKITSASSNNRVLKISIFPSPSSSSPPLLPWSISRAERYRIS